LRRGSILARSGFLLIVTGIALVFYGLGPDRLKLELGFLLMALAVVMIEIAAALEGGGRRTPARGPSSASQPPLSLQETTGNSVEAGQIRRKTQLWLLALSLVGMVAAIVLELLKMVRGLPFWGDYTIDTIAYFCVGGAALFYLLRFALDGIFLLWGRRGKRKKGRVLCP
jgi:hypothetical protein